MSRSRSSHVPRLLTYSQPSASEALHVIFLQRLPESTRTDILDALQKPDQATLDSFREITPYANLRHRALIPMPWIRDQWATSSVVLEMCAQSQSAQPNPTGALYTSFVLVDSGWDAGTVIAAHWTQTSDLNPSSPSGVGAALRSRDQSADGQTTGGGATSSADDDQVVDPGVQPHTSVDAERGGNARLDAVRVPLGLANVLLTLLDDGEVRSFAEVIGEDAYEAAKVDFYRDLRTAKAGVFAKGEKTFEPPTFLPEGLCMSASKLYVVALTAELEASEISALHREILHGDGSVLTEHERPKIEIVPWQGPLPNRSTLANIVHWMTANSDPTQFATENCVFFFIDYLLRRPDGRPQIMAAYSIHYNGKFGGRKDRVRLLPVDTEAVVGYWRAASAHARKPTHIGSIKLLEHGEWNIQRKERIVDIGRPGLGFGFEDLQCCPVFFLRDFTLDEQRQIRSALNVLADYEDANYGGKEYCYAGYLWPDGDEDEAEGRKKKMDGHTIEDLRNLFQQSDPRSPFFKPGGLTFADYPAHFVAVDDRALDPQNPQVILASSMDLYHESNDLGWRYGVLDAAEAHLAWVNLDIANMGHEELVDENEPVVDLFLGDLKEWEAEGGEGME